MQDIIGSTPRNTAEKFTNFGLKEGFQEACSLILRKDLTELVETYKVNIIFFPFTSTRQMKQTRKNIAWKGKGKGGKRAFSLLPLPTSLDQRPVHRLAGTMFDVCERVFAALGRCCLHFTGQLLVAPRTAIIWHDILFG